MCYNKLVTVDIGMMKFLALTLCLLAKITLTLMSSFAMPVVSKNSIFRNLTYVLDADGNFDLPSAFLYALCELLEEQAVLCGNIETVVQRCSVKKVFLKMSQSSQEGTCTRDSFLIKLQAWPATLLKKNIWHRCFTVNFTKFLRTPFFTEYLRWLQLY